MSTISSIGFGLAYCTNVHRGNVYGQLSAFAYKLTLVGPSYRLESQSRLSDGDVKGRSPDVNNHI